MGRNPVVGRQGPEYHAAVDPERAAGAAALAVKQIRSGIGHPETMRRTLAALGLRHHQQTVDGSRTRRRSAGMLYKVRHLVEVTPAGEEQAIDARPTENAWLTSHHAVQPRARAGLAPQRASGSDAARARGSARRRARATRAQGARPAARPTRASRAARCRCTGACRSAGSPIRSRSTVAGGQPRRSSRRSSATEVTPETLYAAGLIAQGRRAGQAAGHRRRRPGLHGARRGPVRVGAREDRGGRRQDRGVSDRTRASPTLAIDDELKRKILFTLLAC